LLKLWVTLIIFAGGIVVDYRCKAQATPETSASDQLDQAVDYVVKSFAAYGEKKFPNGYMRCTVDRIAPTRLQFNYEQLVSGNKYTAVISVELGKINPDIWIYQPPGGYFIRFETHFGDQSIQYSETTSWPGKPDVTHAYNGSWVGNQLLISNLDAAKKVARALRKAILLAGGHADEFADPYTDAPVITPDNSAWLKSHQT
jgi:hypothetical protein